MKRTSLEFSCEKFFIALFRADPRLTGKEIVHFDDERKAKVNAIIVQVKTGARNLAGPGGFAMELIVEHRAEVNSTKLANDVVTAALREVLYNSAISSSARDKMAARAGLSFLLIEDEMTSERQNADDFRRRTITIPLIAVQA